MCPMRTSTHQNFESNNFLLIERPQKRENINGSEETWQTLLSPSDPG